MADKRSAGAHGAHPATDSHAQPSWQREQREPRLQIHKRPDLGDFWAAFAVGVLFWTAAAAAILS